MRFVATPGLFHPVSVVAQFKDKRLRFDKSISKSLTVGQFEIADLAIWLLVEIADVADNETPRSKLKIVV